MFSCVRLYHLGNQKIAKKLGPNGEELKNTDVFSQCDVLQ